MSWTPMYMLFSCCRFRFNMVCIFQASVWKLFQHLMSSTAKNKVDVNVEEYSIPPFRHPVCTKRSTVFLTAAMVPVYSAFNIGVNTKAVVQHASVYVIICRSEIMHMYMGSLVDWIASRTIKIASVVERFFWNPNWLFISRRSYVFPSRYK